MDELNVEWRDEPQWRELSGISAITIRHFTADTDARAALKACHFAWPDRPGEFNGTDPLVAWRGPQELIALGLDGTYLRLLLTELAPGKFDTALAVDMSEALTVFELSGVHLDEWLAHLVDASAIPRSAGRVTRCRLGDVAVLLLRLDNQRVWLAVDRTFCSYLNSWLAYSHEGAFARNI